PGRAGRAGRRASTTPHARARFAVRAQYTIRRSSRQAAVRVPVDGGRPGGGCRPCPLTAGRSLALVGGVEGGGPAGGGVGDGEADDPAGGGHAIVPDPPGEPLDGGAEGGRVGRPVQSGQGGRGPPGVEAAEGGAAAGAGGPPAGRRAGQR